MSHAISSKLPESIQKKVSKDTEEAVPNALHDTGDANKGKDSHAVGDSKVPEAIQQGLPQKVEEKVPNAIHDTGDQKLG